ncbi:MAG: SAM-dependent methyltransferase [Myxococcota bacterium]|jgi:SAM-dependent methyltransferase
MSSSIYNQLSALSEPTRVRLLRLLEVEELGVGELARIVQIPQSTVSRHLKVLRDGGWISRRSVGTASLLRMDRGQLSEAARKLWGVVGEAVAADFEEDARRMRSVLALRGADAAFFERMAGKWDAIRSDLFGDDFLLPTLLALLPGGLTVADLGCGTGTAMEPLAPVCGRIIGVDSSPAMLALATQRLTAVDNAEVRLGSLSALPMEDATVDVALTMLVLHHVTVIGAVLAEVARVLRPGGRLVVLDLVAHDRADFQRSMGHRHPGFSEQTVGALCAGAGLTLSRYQPLPISPAALGPGLFVAVITA